MEHVKKPKTGGRKKGTPNKISEDVRGNILKVFAELGGIVFMKEWAKKKPTEFFMIYAKLLPKDVQVSGTVSLEELVAGSQDHDKGGD